MSASSFCENCGAVLESDALFCEACGRSAAAPAASPEQLDAPHATPATTAPRRSNRGLFVGLGIAGIVVVLGCIAVVGVGFWYVQSQSAAPAALPASTLLLVAVPTRIAPTDVPPLMRVPTDAISPTLAPTALPLPTASTAATLAPPTARATATQLLSSPTPPIAPGLYVTNLRLEHAPPKRGQEIGFYATFLNTAAGEQNSRWVVYVYRPDNFRNSFGETTTAPMTLPVGQKELKSAGSWKLGGGGGCEDFVARVAWKDEGNRVTFFNKPDGAIFELPFQVCP